MSIHINENTNKDHVIIPLHKNGDPVAVQNFRRLRLNLLQSIESFNLSPSLKSYYTHQLSYVQNLEELMILDNEIKQILLSATP